MGSLHWGVFLSLFKTGGGMGMDRGIDTCVIGGYDALGWKWGVSDTFFYGKMLCLPGVCGVMVKGVVFPP